MERTTRDVSDHVRTHRNPHGGCSNQTAHSSCAAHALMQDVPAVRSREAHPTTPPHVITDHDPRLLFNVEAQQQCSTTAATNNNSSSSTRAEESFTLIVITFSANCRMQFVHIHVVSQETSVSTSFLLLQTFLETLRLVEFHTPGYSTV